MIGCFAQDYDLVELEFEEILGGQISRMPSWSNNVKIECRPQKMLMIIRTKNVGKEGRSFCQDPHDLI